MPWMNNLDYFQGSQSFVRHHWTRGLQGKILQEFDASYTQVQWGILILSFTQHSTWETSKPSCIYFMCSSMSLIDEMQLLPWGGKITSESLRFFSPIVIWTILEPTEANHKVLYSAFMDYYKVSVHLFLLRFLCAASSSHYYGHAGLARVNGWSSSRNKCRKSWSK